MMPTVLMSMASEEKPYLPLGQVRRFKPYERCGVKSLRTCLYGQYSIIGRICQAFCSGQHEGYRGDTAVVSVSAKARKMDSIAVGGKESERTGVIK